MTNGRIELSDGERGVLINLLGWEIQTSRIPMSEGVRQLIAHPGQAVESSAQGTAGSPNSGRLSSADEAAVKAAGVAVVENRPRITKIGRFDASARIT
jgi:hypothetical protein